MSMLGAEPTDDPAYKKLSGLESEGLYIQLEEPNPWSPRDHEVWKVWFSDEADVNGILSKAAGHLSELGKPIEISLMGNEFRPRTLHNLKSVSNLRYLNLSDSSAADSHLRSLDGISSLWEIDLSDTYVTASGLEHLRNCSDLRNLQAYSLDLRGRAFVAIRNLKGLRVLCVSGSLVDPDGWNHIASLVSLNELRCSLTDLSDDGLESISKLSELETLIAYSNSVSDVGVRHIPKLKSLRFLFLDNNSITDESLVAFEKLVNLKQIGLSKTQVSDDALAELARSLPELYISSSHGARGNEDNKNPVGEPFFRGIGKVKYASISTRSHFLTWTIIGSVVFGGLLAAFLLLRRRNLRNDKQNRVPGSD